MTCKGAIRPLDRWLASIQRIEFDNLEFDSLLICVANPNVNTRCLWQRVYFDIISAATERKEVSSMLSENIKAVRKAKGLSQEELAIKLNVVRQTISKWEQGLSVPDANMLVSLSEALDTPVSVLLGEIIEEAKVDDLKIISEKLEIINLQLALNRNAKQKKAMAFFAFLVVAIIAIFIILMRIDSPYLGWDYSDPERAVVGVALHAFEWLFIRISPLILVGAIAGIYLTWKRNK